MYLIYIHINFDFRFYEFGATPVGLWLNDFMLELTCFGPFQECLSRDPMNTEKVIDKEESVVAYGQGPAELGGGSYGIHSGPRADMVVSVHPLCQELPLKILNSLDTNGASRTEGRTTPFVTVVTDLGGAHPTWFNPGVDKCFVPSDVLKNAAMDRKVKESQIVQYGLPIRRGFWRFGADYNTDSPPEEQNEEVEMQGVHHKPTIRESLGLKDMPTVLIVGGGDGMGGIVSQAQAVGERLQKLASSSSSPYQMVVVCGNNKAAVTELSTPQTQWGSDIEVSIQGFVNNMDEFMRASGKFFCIVS